MIKGSFLVTAPSDARGGQILADITKDRRIKSVAITYTNNDYGKVWLMFMQQL